MAELEVRVAEMTRRLDDAVRAGKRQATPFRKGALRAAARSEPDYQLILGEVRSSEQLATEETGWRIGSHPAWLHAWVSDQATAYGIDPQRSADVLERVIGQDWSGILSHDGFSSYKRFEGAIHWRNGYVPGTWTDDRLDEYRSRFDDRLLALASRPWAVLEYATLAKHL